MPPPPSAPAPLKLVLTTTSLRNVTIATPSDEFYYEIVTQKWEPLRTKIRRLDPNTSQMAQIAELKMERERSKYTGLKFTSPSLEEGKEGEEVFDPLEKFFLAESGNDGDKILGSFTADDGKRYRWQKVKGSIELFRADEADAKSLARFHTHHRHMGVLRLSQNPYITIDSGLSAILNSVIVSFLLAEGKRRGM